LPGRLEANPQPLGPGVELLEDHIGAPGKPPSRSPPLRRAFWIAHLRLASTGVVVSSMSLP
jgi:hypothetical protein